MSTSAPSISSDSMRRAIPFYARNSNNTARKAYPSRCSPRLLLTSAIPITKIIVTHLKNNPSLTSLVSNLLVQNQSSPPEFPGKRQNNKDPPHSIPPELPELPKSPEIETDTPPEIHTEPPDIPEVHHPPGPGRSPDFPVPPSPPDVPLPPPGTPRSPPPNQLPPGLPPHPDIMPPPAYPPPDTEPPSNISPPPPGPCTLE